MALIDDHVWRPHPCPSQGHDPIQCQYFNCRQPPEAHGAIKRRLKVDRVKAKEEYDARKLISSKEG